MTGLLGSDDLAQMAADLMAVRDDNAVSMVIRRGDTTLDAQSVRLARTGSQGRENESRGAQQSTG
ncbi:MAG: hypothetical protein PVF45_05025, partial [Anaerolineae bacterium]